MRVLLIKPYNISDHIQPALGLGYLAQKIRTRHKVRILDCIKEKVEGKKLIFHLEEFRPDVVGFQIYTYDLARVRKDLEIVKIWNPRVITVAGGPHPSAIPYETFLHIGESLDFIFVGEAEIGFSKFLDLFSQQGSQNYSEISNRLLENIPGLSWRREGKFFCNPPLLVEDLDSLGFPAWDLIKPQEYPEAQHGAFFKRFPIAPIMTGRGCPFNCTFCAGHIITGKRVRKRSIENVMEELKFLTKKFGIREIHIVDDNFTMEKDYVMEFCQRLKEENIDITWATPNGIRIDTLDREMLLAMKKSGYYLASVGIEFGSERMLKLTKKHLTKDEILRGIELIKSVGLEIAGFFMIGYPGETEEEIRKTIKFACELPLLRANFFIFLPLPGTEAYFELKEKLELNRVDWEHFYFTHPAYTYGGFSPWKLRNLQREAFLRFYLRPIIFYRNLTQIKNLRQLKYILKRAYRWLIAT